MTMLLELKQLSVNYGGIQAVQNVSLQVQAGEVVTLIGANGAGKTTTLRAISRLINPRSGTIIYDGHEITRARPDQAVRMGIAQSPEGRRMLARQTVLDNLQLGPTPAVIAPALPPTSNSSSSASRAWPSAPTNWPAHSRAASSRCWRLPAR